MPVDLTKGTDIFTLLDAGKHGATFCDQNNQRKGPITTPKKNDVNYVRLRPWVDPQSASGEGYGSGNNDLATTPTLTKRAKVQGVKLLLDFRYSGFWTSPGRQFKPKAWEKADYPQLKMATYDYTRDAIARFKQTGVLPDTVQIGDEVSGGVLWPEGKSWGQRGSEFDRLTGLLNVAIASLKENLHHGEQMKVVLHLAEGTKNDTSHRWFDEIDKRHAPYDMIGLSMYTYWNGLISALKASMNDISKRYNRDVIVVEATYAYTLIDCDNVENSFQAKEEEDGGHPATVQRQYRYIHDLIQAAIDVPDQRSKGIFHWESAWVVMPGNTWATPMGMKYVHDEWREGNAYGNQALFGCQGKVSPSMKVLS